MPRQGILPFRMEMSHRDDVTARAGLPLVVEAARAFNIRASADKHLRLRKRSRGFSESDCIETLVTLIAGGGDCIEDVQHLRADAGLMRLLDWELPGPDALHRFLKRFHDDEIASVQPRAGQAQLRKEGEALKALRRLNESVVQAACAAATTATVDVDATVIESHKRDALPHYKGGRGYQPVLALWAEQDLVVADEFRDGNVPAGMEPLVCTQRALEALPASVTQRYMRGDTACYEAALLKYLCRGNVGFAIGADMSVELRAECEKVSHWTLLEDRSREVAEVAEVAFISGDWPKHAEPLRYVAMRFTAKQGELFGDGTTVKYLAVVTNRGELSPGEVVRWYWKKAGTVEQAHDIMKNELAAGVMPSGRFGANAAWYRINGLTYNVLSLLRHRVLPERLVRAYPKRLRFELFTIGARIIEHAGQTAARMNASSTYTEELIAARGKLLAIAEAAAR